MNKKLKQREVREISPDKQVVVGFTVVIGDNLTGKTSDFIVEIEKDGDLKEVEANPSFLSGSYDLIRPQLHAILDECLDAYEYTKQPRKNRDEIKLVHPDDGKPFIWSPKSAK